MFVCLLFFPVCMVARSISCFYYYYHYYFINLFYFILFLLYFLCVFYVCYGIWTLVV